MAVVAGATLPAAPHAAISFYSRKASVVVSSVRGPEQPLHLCGSRIRDVIVWAPPSGEIAFSVTLMSYAGRARIGVAADARVLRDGRRIVRELEDEIASIASFASSTTA
jgi:hypothetical protein